MSDQTSDIDPVVAEDAAGPRLRIGELSRRTGVGADTLRAWERRYELLEPARSEGGFRLYGPEDEARVRAMKRLIDGGLSAGEAARVARDGEAVTAAAGIATGAAATIGPLAEAGLRLREALERFDEAEANAVLDRAVAELSVEALADRVLLPALAEVGERWRRGEASVAQEHFATNIIRGRIAGLARNWGAGTGPLAILACPEGELHDVGLLSFGLVLRARGWRVAYLGAATPIETVAETAERLAPAAVVLAALDPEPFRAAEAEIGELAGSARVIVAGAGADAELAARTGTEFLSVDPVEGAETLAAGSAG
jgi:MerR family transcriptional regulator, light-induced transcriptional regulator